MAAVHGNLGDCKRECFRRAETQQSAPFQQDTEWKKPLTSAALCQGREVFPLMMGFFGGFFCFFVFKAVWKHLAIWLMVLRMEGGEIDFVETNYYFFFFHLAFKMPLIKCQEMFELTFCMLHALCVSLFFFFLPCP